MRDKGYVREVDVEVEGTAHTYRESDTGMWCRYSPEPPICLDLGSDVKAAAQKEPVHPSTGGEEAGSNPNKEPGPKSPAWKDPRPERELWEAPRQGETSEEWLKRTKKDWGEKTEAERSMYRRAAKSDMRTATLKVAVRDPKSVWQHWLSAKESGYEDIMLNQRLRSGSGIANWGAGDSVRANPYQAYAGAPPKTTIEFMAVDPPQMPVTVSYMAEDYVAFKMPAGDYLNVMILRVRYHNGAVASRLMLQDPTHWRLTYGTMQKTLTLAELVARGESPTLP